MKKSLHKCFLFFPPVLLMILIFILSAIPMDTDADNLKFLMALDPKFQNLLHLPLFGLLSYLWIRPLTILGISNIPKIVLTVFITIIFGCFDEFHQTFVPGRYGSLMDILLNLAGVMMGIMFFYIKPVKQTI